MGLGRSLCARGCGGEILRGSRARGEAKLVLLCRAPARGIAPGQLERERSQYRDILEFGRRVCGYWGRMEQSALLEPARVPPATSNGYVQPEGRPIICQSTSQ